MAASAFRPEGKRNAWLPYALGASIALHVGLAAWVYMIRSPEILPPPIQRIIPVFIVPKKESLPPPPPPTARQPAPQRDDAGGLSGQGMDRPAIPVRQPRPADPPPTTLPQPVNPDPSASSLNPSAGKGDVPGPGASASPGPGSGVGQGTGPGVGDGRSKGGPAAAAPGWQPRWLRLPTRQQVNSAYPRAAWNEGRSGGALLECTVRVTGRVTDCVVRRESPLGQGFGAAVLTLSRHFRIAPKRVNGRAVEARLEIPYMLLMDPAQPPRKRRDDGSVNRLRREDAPVETIPPPD